MIEANWSTTLPSCPSSMVVGWWNSSTNSIAWPWCRLIQPCSNSNARSLLTPTSTSFWRVSIGRIPPRHLRCSFRAYFGWELSNCRCSPRAPPLGPLVTSRSTNSQSNCSTQPMTPQGKYFVHSATIPKGRENPTACYFSAASSFTPSPPAGRSERARSPGPTHATGPSRPDWLTVGKRH